MLTPYLFDPSSQKNVEEQIDYNDKLNPEKPYRARDMRSYLDTNEADTFQSTYYALPISEKPIAIWRSCFELIVRALIIEEEVTEEIAEELIYAGLGTESEMLPRITEIVTTSSHAPIRLLLDTASVLHFDLTKKIFVKAMELNQIDYRALFPIRVCVHSPDLIIKRLRNKNYKPTDEERQRHFRDRKELAFSVLNSMSIWEIADIVPMESMQTLQNAGRYNVLKGVFTEDTARSKEPAVTSAADVKSALKGKVL